MTTTKLSRAIGNKIRNHRLRLRYSQEAFADHINFDRSNYGAIERGERNISLRTLAKIAVGLEAEVGEIFPPLVEIRRLLNSGS